MHDLYLGLKFALSYFSIIPISFGSGDDLSDRRVLGYMLLSFPLVGAILGSISIAIYTLLESLGWLGAVVGAISYMIFYGFLHTEAVADVADAIYASHSDKDPYIIIKEPTVGAMGVLWSIVCVVLKIASMIFLLLHGLYTPLIAILVVSRYTLLVLFYTKEFRSSFATTLKESFTTRYLILSSLLYAVVIYLLIGIDIVMILPIGLIVGYSIATAIGSRIGFINGDVLGATLEATEIILAILVAMLWL
jgi:adenosylcobinamide-GDP ribazoletransferase